MAFLESTVVVYLRDLYYPDGFDFPLKLIAPEILKVELLREIATIIMLVTIGIIAGRNSREKFAFFLYCFGVWDIFYYIWLKILLNWPASLLTWDILFLIPITWVGPILAPVICSLTMILFAGCIIYLQRKGITPKKNLYVRALLLIGVLMILTTFIWDYFKLIIEGDFLSGFWTLATNEEFQLVLTQYIPDDYNWTVFVVGEVLILIGLYRYTKYS
ncbi:hypothetical protein JYU16_02285 [bacterium AH-315-M05]|nr:hypothetical protein [bacterium AH-315-M05]